ncbi:PaaI family thioesterase [Burkholderia sp. SRS-46]|nr:PaaI family thioesterase [Burkholderia sp. SRS-46]
MNAPATLAAPCAPAGDAPPDGFEALAAHGGFIARVGTLYWHPQRRIVGIRIGEHHLNHLGMPHGGMLATLADTAIGLVINRFSGARQQSVTVHLGLDYLSAAQAGDWVEAHVDIDKRGARLHFASCRLTSGERCLLKASATFAVVAAQ